MDSSPGARGGAGGGGKGIRHKNPNLDKIVFDGTNDPDPFSLDCSKKKPPALYDKMAILVFVQPVSCNL